jgi:hypothetical protein
MRTRRLKSYGRPVRGDLTRHTFPWRSRNLFRSCKEIGPTTSVVQRADIPDAFENLHVDAIDERVLAKR